LVKELEEEVADGAQGATEVKGKEKAKRKPREK